MKNFEKHDIIRDVAYDKSRTKFLPRQEQMQINTRLKHKLLRFVGEIQAVENRPEAMRLFDAMMNDMHGQRVKDLYAWRKAGHHVVALLSSSTPPEIVYAMENHIPVGVCMGAGEVEQYAHGYTHGMCSLTRSMVGFMKTGMCVFFNLADQVLSSDFCPDIQKASGIIEQLSDDFQVYCVASKAADDGKMEIDYKGFQAWIDRATQGAGLKRERLLAYGRLYSEIREAYQSIFNLRKGANPPIDGRNSLWIQQLFPVEEPTKLLSALHTLRDELIQMTHHHTGCNGDGTKKRVMLISPRIMPPFAEIYRLIENNHAVVVCEEMDMGITNITYNMDSLKDLAGNEEQANEASVRYVMEGIDTQGCSGFKAYNINRILQKVRDYQVDAVVVYSFINCRGLTDKIQQINDGLLEQGVRSMVLTTDYLGIYEKEEQYSGEIGAFLKF